MTVRSTSAWPAGQPGDAAAQGRTLAKYDEAAGAGPRCRCVAANPVGGTPQALKALLDAELKRWGAVVEAAQIPKE